MKYLVLFSLLFSIQANAGLKRICDLQSEISGQQPSISFELADFEGKNRHERTDILDLRVSPERTNNPLNPILIEAEAAYAYDYVEGPRVVISTVYKSKTRVYLNVYRGDNDSYSNGFLVVTNKANGRQVSEVICK